MSKKNGGTPVRQEGSGTSTLLLARDEEEGESDDELHAEDLPSTVTPVRVKTARNAQSGLEISLREGATDVLDVDQSWDDTTTAAATIAATPRKSLFVDRSVHRSAAVQSLSQDELSKAESQETFLNAASHLESLLSEDPSALDIIKAQVIRQLTSKHYPPLLPPHLLTEYEVLHQLLSQTVQAGEGNSMLIIGSRGSGKTTLVERAISDLTDSNRDDFHVVRLNGFIHTDDKLALREIWRQLGKDLEGSDEDIGLRTNYADTLTSLLALLSHQDETHPEEDEDETHPEEDDDNDYENDHQQQPPKTSTTRSIIFILNEFDLFAHHPRQTLLYNLFDVAQSHRNAPIAVLGLTTKITIIDHLEKRVKSRFSQRTLHVPLPNSFPVFKSACLHPLLYHHHHHPPSSPPEPILSAWTTYITTLLSTPPLTTLLHSNYHLSNSPASFLAHTALPLLTSLLPHTLSSPPP